MCEESERTPPPLQLPRDLAMTLYTALGEMLGQDDGTGWTPPPPGSTRHKLPDDILALIIKLPYLSTACETGLRLGKAQLRHTERFDELALWEERMHMFCRLNNKYTDAKCSCTCGHPRDESES